MDTTDPYLASPNTQAIVEATPGREASFVPPDPPGPEDTPWRSKFYVTSRHSADGNAYAKDAPIPEAEAIRQGLIPAESPMISVAPKPCSRCAGRGTYSKKRPANHREGCACVFCSACPRCAGSGQEPAARP